MAVRKPSTVRMYDSTSMSSSLVSSRYQSPWPAPVLPVSPFPALPALQVVGVERRRLAGVDRQRHRAVRHSRVVHREDAYLARTPPSGSSPARSPAGSGTRSRWKHWHQVDRGAGTARCRKCRLPGRRSPVEPLCAPATPNATAASSAKYRRNNGRGSEKVSRPTCGRDRGLAAASPRLNGCRRHGVGRTSAQSGEGRPSARLGQDYVTPA